MTFPEKILFINYYFPPVKVVGAVRLFHLSRELTAGGVDVFVLTCRNRRYFRRDEGLEPTVREIHTVPAWDWRTLRLRWRGDGATTVRSKAKETRWGRRLVRAQDSFPLHFLLGDGGLVYVLTAYFRACRLIRRHGIGHIFSSYRPYADHWVAFLLKKRFPHLYWIADFRDLHVDPVRRNVLSPGLQTEIDRRLLRQADLVTTVSRGLAAHLPVAPGRLHILRNAIAGELLERRAQPTEHFTITYTGSIYRALQRAECLWRALTELLNQNKICPEDLQLVYLGKDGETWDQWMLEHNLTSQSLNLGERRRTEVLAWQSASSLNLLLSWSTEQLSGILTSKVYEYLSSGVPTLALVNGPEDGELRELVEDTGGGRVFCTEEMEESRLRSYLLDRYAEWQTRRLARAETTKESLRTYTWSWQVRGLLASLAGSR